MKTRAMGTRAMTSLAVIAVFALPLATPWLTAGGALAAPAATPALGTSEGHDLDALWSSAQADLDPARRDAVLLLEEQRVEVQATGAVAVTVHRVVWIGTATGIRAYADLRVPWNSATSTLEVTKLRTWREGRWWPDAGKLSDTAIVHTLPYAVDHADDYTAMRETMLLHDGVELPCIMETIYTIREGNLPAADEVFVLPQRDPAALVRLTVSAPLDRPLHHRELNGAPAPVAAEQGGRRVLTWILQPAPALRLPVTAEPAAYEPAVAWSTWRDDRALGEAWYGAFWEAAVAPPAVLDSLRAATLDAGGDQARLEAGGRWLDRSVRNIHQDDRWWAFSPRPAARTWETAYGHGLDRAVLWAALLRGDGWQVAPVLADTPGAPAAPDLPHLGGRGRLLLQVTAGGAGEAPPATWVCDPADFSVHGAGLLDGRPLLWLAGAAKPERRAALAAGLTLELSLAAGDSAWSGSGFADGRGALAFSEQLTGSATALTTQAGALAASVLAGAQAPAATATALTADASAIRFDLTVPYGKPDQDGRRVLVVGRPRGGLLDRLPADCRLDEDARATPVLLGGPWRQMVVVRLKPSEGATVARPSDRDITSAAGRFTLKVTESGGWLTLRRELALTADAGVVGNWPALRALLLEEADAANGTVALRPKE